MKRHINTVLLLSVVTSMTGCQSYWNPEPDFGSTVNDAIRAQAVNKNPPTGNPYATAHMDGVSAKATVDNYQKSFTAPARTGQGSGTGSLININAGSGTGSSVMGGAP